VRRAFFFLFLAISGASGADPGGAAFPPPLETYQDAAQGVWGKLTHRVSAEPFNLIGTLIFLVAIGHTFMVARFRHRAHFYEHEYQKLDGVPLVAGPEADQRRSELYRMRFRATVFHFLGEIEAVFGIWLIPLFIAIWLMKGFSTAVHYVDGVNYSEAIFVTVIMAMAATRPVILFAEGWLAKGARLLGGTPTAWWFAILTGGPILGSLITEPAAMTLCALLLGQRFYAQAPSMKLRYATLALLFVNISVGGTLTHFAAPPVVMVAGKWDWGILHMLTNFGWKAIVGIVIANVTYWLIFRRELDALPRAIEEEQKPIPAHVTLVHLGFLAWTVLNAHHSSLVVIGALFFIAFLAATDLHQEKFSIRGPLLVGFFLAGLIIHGGCQQWWIEPVLGSLGEWPLMIGSTLLTAVNDNAAITYLASLVPTFTDELKYAVVAGAVTGGGLTVIANAPNPAGQSILQKYFGEDGISPAKLFLNALIPTAIMGAVFMVFR
jgi:hypothetical protein